MLLPGTRRPRWPLAVGGVVAVAAAVAIVIVATRGRDEPPPRARIYTETSACLLTGPRGIADPTTAPIWAGMQDASATTHAKMSYLAVAGPETTGNALPYTATLLQRHCGTIIATGAPQTEAAYTIAAQHPELHVIVIGATTSAAAPTNVTTIPTAPANKLQTAVATTVTGFTNAD